MQRRLVIMVSAIVALLCAPSVQAITYGQPDEGRHPNVGTLLIELAEGTFPNCSGTLIAPDVFLTAAHCDVGTSTVQITFDEIYSASATLHSGTFIPDPEFSQRQNDPHDIAVVLLDEPISGIDPARLPSAGQLSKLKKGRQFTAVGYGAAEAVNQPGGPVNPVTDVRQFAVGSLNAVNPAWLHLSQNPHTGDAGTCYGDSGGPNFLWEKGQETNIIAGITITGDSLCKATNVIYRLDTASARDFLAPYVALPKKASKSQDQRHAKRDHHKKKHRR